MGHPNGGQTAILVHWSAAQQTTEMLADQRTGKIVWTSASGLPKLSFRYSAALNFGLFKKILKTEEIVK
jgi:hypothetical protein